jgi:hypothetical protein
MVDLLAERAGPADPIATEDRGFVDVLLGRAAGVSGCRPGRLGREAA